MFKEYNQNQTFLLPPSLDDFIPESHPAHLINDLVEQLDLGAFQARYTVQGQPAYHPKMIIKIILYGFTVGIFSSRKQQRACQENMAFKYLAGMQTPAFKTFIEFRKRHHDDMKQLFLQTVKLAKTMGLAKLGSVALDGTKIEANTSKHKAMSYGRMLEEEKRLSEEIEGLLKAADRADQEEDQAHGSANDGFSLSEDLAFKEARLKKIQQAKAALEEREKKDHPDQDLDPKKQISFADHDARCFSKKSEGTEYIYNSQAAVDMSSQIIVENHIEQSVHDARAAGAALEKMKQDLGQCPENLVADAGYGNRHTLESCQDHGVIPVCATSRESEETGKKSILDSFVYDQNRNQFTCPHGRVFEFDHVNENLEEVTYRSREALALGCRCGNKGPRVLTMRKGHMARRQLNGIMAQEDHRELYKKRKSTVEPVFGQIKEAMGFRRYFYRGLKKVAGEWNLVCAAFNIKKMAQVLNIPEKLCPAASG